MLERHLIQSSGVGNTRVNGEVVGFQFRIRMPSYRGMAASLIDGAKVVVDGEKSFDFHETKWQLGGTTYTLDELHASEDLRWQLQEPATILVELPGGLTPGIHQLDVEFRLRMSYIPIEHQPSVYKVSKKVTVIS